MPKLSEQDQRRLEHFKKQFSFNEFESRTDKEGRALAVENNANVGSLKARTADYDTEQKIREEFYLQQLQELSPEDYAKILLLHKDKEEYELLPIF
jgi:hypothetical protein